MQSHFTRLVRATFAAALLLAAPADAAMAEPYADAVAANKRGDYPTAMRLYRPLAEQGHALAQSALAFMYENGQAVAQNYAEAVNWYRLAGEQGDAFAQTRLGFMYQNGEGVPQNDAAAAKWLRLAAEQGRVVAQDALGVMYFTGRGVPKDYVAASMWLTLSAAHGDRDAANWRDAVAKLMTPEQTAQAQQLVREWKPKPGR